MGILELFRMKRPSKTDAYIAEALREFQLKHAEAVECLVCQAIRAGYKPEELEIVSDPVREGIRVRVRRKHGG
jgi:hypothetical protein